MLGTQRHVKMNAGWLRSLCMLSACALSLIASAIHAQPSPPAEYERLMTDGMAAYAAHDYAHAAELFERAHRQSPSARTLHALGVTAFAQDHYTQAYRHIDAALRDERSPLTASQRADAQDALSWMNASLTTLDLQVTPAGARVLVDGRELTQGPILLAPGRHELQVSAAGYLSQTQHVEGAAGERLARHYSLEHVPPPAHVAAAAGPQALSEAAPSARQKSPQERTPPITTRWWFWTAVGAVVVAGVSAALIDVGTSRPPAGVRVEALVTQP